MLYIIKLLPNTEITIIYLKTKINSFIETRIILSMVFMILSSIKAIIFFTFRVWILILIKWKRSIDVKVLLCTPLSFPIVHHNSRLLVQDIPYHYWSDERGTKYIYIYFIKQNPWTCSIHNIISIYFNFPTIYCILL